MEMLNNCGFIKLWQIAFALSFFSLFRNSGLALSTMSVFAMNGHVGNTIMRPSSFLVKEESG